MPWSARRRISIVNYDGAADLLNRVGSQRYPLSFLHLLRQCKSNKLRQPNMCRWLFPHAGTSFNQAAGERTRRSAAVGHGRRLPELARVDGQSAAMVRGVFDQPPYDAGHGLTAHHRPLRERLFEIFRTVRVEETGRVRMGGFPAARICSLRRISGPSP